MRRKFTISYFQSIAQKQNVNEMPIFYQYFGLNCEFLIVCPAYYLPSIYYGEQIVLGLEGPFLFDANDSMNQVTVKLMTGSRPIDVSFIFFFLSFL